MSIVFGSDEANAILERDKFSRRFGPGGLVDHEATTPVAGAHWARIAPNGEAAPRGFPPLGPQHGLANPDWEGAEDELIAITKRVIGIGD